jgi:hypothetical protein
MSPECDAQCQHGQCSSETRHLSVIHSVNMVSAAVQQQHGMSAECNPQCQHGPCSSAAWHLSVVHNGNMMSAAAQQHGMSPEMWLTVQTSSLHHFISEACHSSVVHTVNMVLALVRRVTCAQI